MFSHIIGRKPARQWIAPAISILFFCGRADAQLLNAPVPQPGVAPLPGSGSFIAPLPTPPAPVPYPTGLPSGLGAEESTTTANLIHRIQSPTERMEMTVNSSRIISLDQNIPRAQVNNKEIVELTALSPNEIQVMAKKSGVTQINLWNEKGQIYTIDCVVYGDARELADLLRTEFPSANLKVRPMANSVLLTGFVDRADQVSQIIQIAQDYYPKVLPNIRVGGVQKILLHVKVAEVSRTKLRALGFDFGQINGNSFGISSIGGLISAVTPAPQAGGAATVANAADAIAATGLDTARFGIVDGRSGFFAFLEALRREDLLKILSDPTLVTVSGRPAFFNSGGEFPILVPQSLGTVSIDYKKFGTQVDFVPIVLGNGNIRLEVRPRISEIDNTRSITINGTTVPGLRVREADTGVEMRPGQTLAIAGLIQSRLEAHKQGVPWLMDMPYIGAAFRRLRETEEEVELLILVTPEVVEPLECEETPQCLPGLHSDVPNDCQLYMKGYMEVPAKGPCGPGGCGPQGADGGVGPNGMPTPFGNPNSQPEGIAPGAPTPAPSQSNNSAPTNRSASSKNGATGGGRATASSYQANPQNSASVDSRYNPSRPQETRTPNGAAGSGNTPGLIGPVGYDVLN